MQLTGDCYGRPDARGKRRTFECHFLLGKLSREEIDTLLHYARVEHYPAGYEIYAKGSPGQSMMAVSSGTVKSGCTASGPDRFQAFGALACQLPSLPHAKPPDTRRSYVGIGIALGLLLIDPRNRVCPAESCIRNELSSVSRS